MYCKRNFNETPLPPIHMDLFEHLSLIPFLLVALGLIKIISVIAHYIEISNKYRESEIKPIKLYWVHSLFIFATFIALLLYWWNSYQFNDYREEKNLTWNMGEYFLYMLPGIFLYLSLEIAIPEMKNDDPIDMKEHYYNNSNEMWATVSFVAMTSVLFSLFLYGNPVISRATLSRVALLLLLIPMCFTRKEKVHRIMIVVFVITMLIGVPENWELQMDASLV